MNEDYGNESFNSDILGYRFWEHVEILKSAYRGLIHDDLPGRGRKLSGFGARNFRADMSAELKHFNFELMELKAEERVRGYPLKVCRKDILVQYGKSISDKYFYLAVNPNLRFLEDLQRDDF